MDTTNGFFRVSPLPQDELAALGPLHQLLGSWFGNHGMNLIAVPVNVKPSKDAPDGKGFQLEVQQYSETLTFSPIGALVPNKDGTPFPNFMLIPGLQYELRIADVASGAALHVETGMWLRLNYNVDQSSNAVARLANIPHGNALVAVGTYSEFDGAPDIPIIDAKPEPTGGKLPGYTDPYSFGCPDKLNCSDPNQTLSDYLKQQYAQDQTIARVTTLSVSTKPDGGIVNIPYIKKNADARDFSCNYWIETVVPKVGAPFLQLQYSQTTDLFFAERVNGTPGLIRWPHVNVNTLVKQ